MEIWDVLISMIRIDLMLLVVFIWAVGLFLKKAPWFHREWMIPFILLGLSIVMTFLYMAVVLEEGVSARVFIISLTQAVMIAALAVFGNELLKQGFKKRIEDDDNSSSPPLWIQNLNSKNK